MKIKYLTKGFTIIELMVVITLMVLVSSTAIVNVTSFTQNQGILDDTKTLVSEFRSVYSKAIGVFYPPGCDSVSGYTVSMVSGSKNVTVTAKCSPDITETKQYILKSSTFFANYSFTISSPGGALSAATVPIEIKIKSDGNPTGLIKTIKADSYGVFEILDD